MLTKAKAVISGVATAALLSASMLVAAPSAEAKSFKHDKYNNYSYNYGKHHHHHHHGYWYGGGDDFFVPGIIGFIAGLAVENAIHHHR